jgi:DNA-binding PadR family transcriptional regulator
MPWFAITGTCTKSAISFGTKVAHENASGKPDYRNGTRQKKVDSTHFFIILEEMPARNYLGDFDLMILLALMRLGEDAYGVPISREIEQQSGREVAVGTVYAALDRLEQKGLVSSKLGECTPERGGRAKRYFHITKRGLREVREARRALINMWQGLTELEGGRT